MLRLETTRYSTRYVQYMYKYSTAVVREYCTGGILHRSMTLNLKDPYPWCLNQLILQSVGFPPMSSQVLALTKSPYSVSGRLLALFSRVFEYSTVLLLYGVQDYLYCNPVLYNTCTVCWGTYYSSTLVRYNTSYKYYSTS
jgi:hypothetical protein